MRRQTGYGLNHYEFQPTDKSTANTTTTTTTSTRPRHRDHNQNQSEPIKQIKTYHGGNPPDFPYASETGNKRT